jgi:hypothetical protein
LKLFYLTPIVLLVGCVSGSTSGGTQGSVSADPSVSASFVSGACPNLEQELSRVDRLAVRVERLDMRSNELSAVAVPSRSESEALRHEILRFDKELLALEASDRLDCAEAADRFDREVLAPFQQIQMRH